MKKLLLIILVTLLSNIAYGDIQCFTMLKAFFKRKPTVEMLQQIENLPKVVTQLKVGSPIRKSRLNDPSFWLNESPMTFDSQGKNYLTFSFDSEIYADDAYRIIMSDPKTAKMFSEKVNYHFSAQDLIKMLDVSEKQFRSNFILRKAVPRDGEVYFLTDLQPSYFELAISKFENKREQLFAQIDERLKSLNRINRYLNEMTKVYIEKNNLPFNSHLDVGNVEITHATYEKKPLDFFQQINKLHMIAKLPNTHLHIGLPTEYVSDQQAIEIARILEAKIILNRLELAPKKGKSLTSFNTDTNMGLKRRIGQRGIVKLGLSEWSKPIHSHNLEIRQWSSIEDGMNNVMLASNLAKNSKNLFIPKFDAGIDTIGFIDDLGNLKGALMYLSLFLERKSDYKDISIQLLKYSQKVDENMEPMLRQEIAQFLKENKISNLLSAELFLK